MPTKNKAGATFMTKVSNLEGGVEANIPARSSLTVAGTSMTQPAIITQLESIEELGTDVATTKAAWQAKVAAQKAGMPAAKTFVDNLIQAIKTSFGPSNPLLPSFGIALPKPRAALSSLDKAAAQAAAANTRVVRGTMSAKKRASITTAGKPGITVLSPTGTPLLTVAPVPPGSSAAPTVTVAAQAPGSTPDDGSSSTDVAAPTVPAAGK